MSRKLHLIALAVSLFAVIAPSAHGDDWFRDASPATTTGTAGPDDRAGTIGVGGVTLGSRGRVPIDSLAASYLREMGLTPSQIESWAVGACSHEVKPVECFPPSTSNAPAPPVGSRTFDWADAGIGAGATLGLVLLLAGLGAVVVTGREHRRRHVARA
jgi:hypothetical protein